MYTVTNIKVEKKKATIKWRSFLFLREKKSVICKQEQEWQTLWYANTYLYVQYVFICNWMWVHTYTHCIHLAVCMSSCTASVLCLCILRITLWWLWTLPRHPLFALTTLSWMVCSVAAHNAGWILWPTTPTWHIHKTLRVTSDNRWKENW